MQCGDDNVDPVNYRDVDKRNPIREREAVEKICKYLSRDWLDCPGSLQLGLQKTNPEYIQKDSVLILKFGVPQILVLKQNEDTDVRQITKIEIECVNPSKDYQFPPYEETTFYINVFGLENKIYDSEEGLNDGEGLYENHIIDELASILGIKSS